MITQDANLRGSWVKCIWKCSILSLQLFKIIPNYSKIKSFLKLPLQLFLDGALLCAFKTLFSKFPTVSRHCFLNQISSSLHNQKLIGNLFSPTFSVLCECRQESIGNNTSKSIQASDELDGWLCCWPKLRQSEPFPGIWRAERPKRKSLRCSPVLGSGIPALPSFTRWKSQTKEGRMRAECREERKHRRANPGDIPLTLDPEGREACIQLHKSSLKLPFWPKIVPRQGPNKSSTSCNPRRRLPYPTQVPGKPPKAHLPGLWLDHSPSGSG